MKKIFLVMAITFGLIATSNAQISSSSLKNVTDQAKSAVASSGANASTLTSGIMSALTSKLALSNAQVPKVKDLVTKYITDKMSIQNLLKTDKAKYLSKLAGLSGVLNGGLKSVLNASQYTKFLGLKPATNDSKNPLSQLFY